MIRRYLHRILAAGLCLIFVAACASGEPPTPTAVPTTTPQPTSRPTVIPTTAPTIAPTPQPRIQEGGPIPGEPIAAGSLRITGLVTTTLTLTPQDLAAYPQVDIPAEAMGTTQGIRGPRLDDLLSKAGVQPAAHSIVFSTATGRFVERPLDQIVGRFDVLVAIHDDRRLQIIDPRLDDPVALDDVSGIEVR